jgi:hypothetical protein
MGLVSLDPPYGVPAMKDTDLPRIEQFEVAKQQRMDLLVDKNSEGTITSAERTELEALVAEAEQLMLANSKRLARR